ncbi:response regulator [bacterium]|nr:response regulator [bacterium]
MARIMIVDDEEHIVETLQLAFKSRGHETIPLSDPTSVLSVVREEHPDAIILDLLMPGIDGYKLYHDLMADELLSSTPVAIITGHSGPLYERISREIGIALHLVKPFNPFDVVSQVEELINKSTAP